jgi:hypothetical protein
LLFSSAATVLTWHAVQATICWATSGSLRRSGAVLADADDKSEIFRQLGLKLNYYPGRRIVEAKIEPAPQAAGLRAARRHALRPVRAQDERQVEQRPRLLPVRYPAEYALANRVSHPKNVHLKEADVIGHVDDWLAELFVPDAVNATVTQLTE